MKSFRLAMLFTACLMTIERFIRRIGLAMLAMFLLSAPPALAVDPVAVYVLDPTLANAPQFRQKVWPWRVTSGPSGKVYVTLNPSGPLSGSNNQRRGAVIRLNADGTIDQSFNVGPQFADAFAVLELANGQVLVGVLDSNESADSGAPLYRVFRLNADGTRDTSYQSPAFVNLARFMTLQSDGKLLVAVQPQGGAANGGLTGLQRLNSDGSLDTTFVSPAIAPADSIFFTNIVVDATGRILVGGTFTSVAGQPRQGIARLLSNGALDGTFVTSGFVIPDLGNSIIGQVRGIGIQMQGANAGKIIVAASKLQTTAGSQTACPSTATSSRCPVLRLNTDGSLDTSFTLVRSADTGILPGGRAKLLSVLSNDKLLIVDAGVARLNADGSIDSTYSKPVFSLETFWMDTLADGRVYVPISEGSTVNGSATQQPVMRFNADGTADATFAPGTLQREIYPENLLTFPNGRFLTWGDFDTVGAVTQVGAARFNADGTLDSSYALSGITNLLGISSAGALSDGRIVAVISNGSDRKLGLNSPLLARFAANGAADASFIPDATAVSALAESGSGMRVLPDGTTLVWTQNPQRVESGGVFFKRLSVSGALDNTFIGLSTTGALFGALFRDATNTITSGTIGDFNILGRYTDGRIIAAATKGPYPQNAVAMNYTLLRLNADGTIDNTFTAPSEARNTTQFGTFSAVSGNPYTATVGQGSPFSGVLPQADGSVIVFGSFTSLGGQPAAGIARLTSSGSVDSTFSVGTGAELRNLPGRIAQVKSITPDADGRYWVSGMFDTFGGKSAAGLTRLNADGTVDNGFSSPVAYRSYIGGNTRVVFDAAGRPMVLGTYLPSTDGVPNAIHRLALSMPLNLTYSWNLVGNGFNAPLDVATAFGNANNVSTVWKWGAASLKWAFYTPTLADGGAAYAASKGYDFLTTINGGEGFWVNAKGPFALQLSGSAVPTIAFADALASNALPTGWSLIAIGDNKTASGFANAISVNPPAAGTSVSPSLTTLWTWDATQVAWYFFAPSLVNSGTQANYISSKGYLDFGTKTLTPTTGFWVNHP